LGLEGEYRFERRRVMAEELPAFVSELRGRGDVAGVSCSMPHKQALLALLDDIDPVARAIGAVNTIVCEPGHLTGTNTDWTGAVRALGPAGTLRGRTVAVLGAGGAAKAVVYGLTQGGARVTVYNRTAGKAEELAHQFGCGFGPLDSPEIADAEIICNTTNVGMGDPDASPLAPEFLRAGLLVFDAVTHPYDTKLLRDARAAGAQIIHGTEMLLYQGAAQFKMFTGQEAPVDAMRAALEREITARGDYS
jgi:shikimate dehydrogenase